MLLVKVELHSALTGEVKTLAEMRIANDGTSDNPRRGNYNVRNSSRRGRVENFPRKSYVVWRLVLRALRSLYPEER